MFAATLPAVPPVVPARLSPPTSNLVWRPRYEGIAHVAYLGERALAGVSGPWSDRYVLTWWDRPGAPQALELFATQREAMQAVEAWAYRQND